MARCPICGRPVAAGATECDGCGAALERRAPAPRKPPTTPPPIAPQAARASRGGGSLLRALVVGVSLGSLVVGAYWWVKIRPRLQVIDDPYVRAEPGRERKLALEDHGTSDCDRVVDLGVEPIGLTWDGRRFLAANRGDPWGFVEVGPTDDGRRYSLRQRPVIETRFIQRIGLRAVTWDGEHFVAYTDRSWFQRHGTDVFTLHDPETLRVERILAAPPLIGCLAFDGAGYWAATRRNTPDAEEEAWLYRLDRELQVVARHEPPGVGCQGLAWDGENLWFADTFRNSLFALDLTAAPRIVTSYGTRFDHLSGIAHDGEHLWLAEFGEDRLHRVHPRLQAAWRARAWGRTELTVSVAGRVVASTGRSGGTPLEGVWFGAMEGDRSGEWTLLVENDRYFVKGPGRREWFRGRYEIVAEGRPAAIDLRVEDCDCEFRGDTSRGLLLVRDDLLTLAMAEPGRRERPTTMRPGDGKEVLRFQRY